MSRKHESYADKLRRPEWQKKRLEILNRDGWKCTDCGDDKSELHVHHLYYLKGKQPWEYEDAAFRTLCANCHQAHEASSRYVLSLLGSFKFSEVHAIGVLIDELAKCNAGVLGDFASALTETDLGSRVAVKGMQSAIEAFWDGYGTCMDQQGQS